MADASKRDYRAAMELVVALLDAIERRCDELRWESRQIRELWRDLEMNPAYAAARRRVAARQMLGECGGGRDE